jgi:hypothetical protein
MESIKPYRIYYATKYICTVSAYTKFQALDKVYYTLSYLNIDRNLLTTKK